MPWPIRPAPATKTRSIAMARGYPARVPSGASSRSAAASGSEPRAPRRRAIAPRSPRRSAALVVEPARGPARRRSAQTWAAARGRRRAAGRARRRRAAAVPIERREQRRDAVAGRRGRDEDLGPLRAAAASGSRAPSRRGRRHEHRPQLGRRPLGARPVALVDDDEVGDLEQAGLDRLDLVAHLGRLEDDRRVGRRRDLDLALAGPDGLDAARGRSRPRRAPRPRRVVVAARPPAWPRAAIERMKTSRSSA